MKKIILPDDRACRKNLDKPLAKVQPPREESKIATEEMKILHVGEKRFLRSFI